MEYGIGVAQNQTPIKQKKTKANWESLDEGVKLTATSREKKRKTGGRSKRRMGPASISLDTRVKEGGIGPVNAQKLKRRTTTQPTGGADCNLKVRWYDDGQSPRDRRLQGWLQVTAS